MRRIPMFPLGSVLFPRAVMPLRIFETRYLEMMGDCLAGDKELGVVLIERGSEVGGGDVRFGLGTRARIGHVAELGDDQLAVALIGLDRIEVERWAGDDPYPVAEVVDRPEVEAASSLPDSISSAVTALERFLAFASELGADVGGGGVEIPEDPMVAAWGLCAASPIGPLDSLELLGIDDPSVRMDRLAALIDEGAETLRAQLEGPPA